MKIVLNIGVWIMVAVLCIACGGGQEPVSQDSMGPALIDERIGERMPAEPAPAEPAPAQATPVQPTPARPDPVELDPGDETPKTEEEILREQVSMVKADLRTVATGLEAYYVDWTAYPKDLYALTTPISYVLPKMFKDPFTEGKDYQYRKLGDRDWMIWSVGPDGKDDGGIRFYDESKGLKSPGDIMRKKQ